MIKFAKRLLMLLLFSMFFSSSLIYGAADSHEQLTDLPGTNFKAENEAVPNNDESYANNDFDSAELLYDLDLEGAAENKALALNTIAAVFYIDENGLSRTADNVSIIENHAVGHFNSGWYKLPAGGNFSFSGRPVVFGDVHIIIENNADWLFPQGINVPLGSSLTIYSQSSDDAVMGLLTASAGMLPHAAIGSDLSESGGAIIINGGNIKATGGIGGAGIGSGNSGTGGYITIQGSAVVEAEGFFGGAGLGGGVSGSGGFISIQGEARVRAFGQHGSAGIGHGHNTAQAATTIIISDRADVMAIGGGGMNPVTNQVENLGGAGLGGGSFNNIGGEIIISGAATVRAEGRNGGAGIGSGMVSTPSAFSVTIEGNAHVLAIGGEGEGNYPMFGGAGIGGGSRSSGGNITIRGYAFVRAEGRSGGAGIGGGSGYYISALFTAHGPGDGGNIRVESGTVIALGSARTGGTNDFGGGAGIGGGGFSSNYGYRGGDSGNIFIGTGANVTAVGGSSVSGVYRRGGAGIGGGAAPKADGRLGYNGNILIEYGAALVVTAGSHGESEEMAGINVATDLPLMHSITFAVNGGHGEMISRLLSDGSDFDIPVNIFFRAAHVFDGWSLEPTGNRVYSCGATISNIQSSITLYAVWLPIAAIGIKLNPSSLELTVGESGTLAAILTPENAFEAALLWESDNNAVATVNNGSVSAVSAGTAAISVKTVDGFYDTSLVSVERVMRTLTFPVESVSRAYGSVPFTINPALSAVGGDILFESSKPNVATVNPNTGEVTIVAVGETTISAVATETTTHVEVGGRYVLTVTGGVLKAPGNLTATAGNRQVILSWSAPVNNSGSEVTHFEVSNDNGISWTVASSDNSHSFSGLTNGILYNFRVRAVSKGVHGLDSVISAMPAAGSWTVIFKLNGGNIDGDTADVVRSNVIDGTDVLRPANPVRSAYVFAGWSGSYTNVIEDRIISALWLPREGENNGGQGSDNAGSGSSDNDSSDTNNVSSSSEIAGRYTLSDPGVQQSDSFLIYEEIQLDAEFLQEFLNAEQIFVINRSPVQILIPPTVLAELLSAIDSLSITDEGAALSVYIKAEENESGRLSYVDVYFEIGRERIMHSGSYITVRVDLSLESWWRDFSTWDKARITALQNDSLISSNFNGESGILTVRLQHIGGFSIEHVQTLQRIILKPGSPFIGNLTNDTESAEMDVAPVIQNDRTLVPIRFIAEMLGAELDWLPATNYTALTVNIATHSHSLGFAVGELTPELMAFGMDVPAFIMENRVMVPLRFVAEFFAAVVIWEEESQTIEIMRDVAA